MHNLLTNAVQALHGAGTPQPAITVTLQAQPTQGHAHLLLRDNGPGFTADQLNQVFEPFFTTREGGLGLGLPLCETLAQALGGTLAARNRSGPGTGAELELTLPLAVKKP